MSSSVKTFLVIFAVLLPVTINAQLNNPAQSVVDVNNITSWVKNNGFHNWYVRGNWNGAFPNGYNIGMIFSEGITWGGKINDGNIPLIRVNGNTHSSGCASVTRLYRVRPDYLSGNLTQDAANFFRISVGEVTQQQIEELRQQYQADWNEWPADEGAPFEDVNNDGLYDPNIDIPGVTGSSQSLFVKYNDEGNPIYGSPPIGLEISETYWAYAVSGAVGNVIFKKVDVTYSGTDTTSPAASIDDMYINQWADPDVGSSVDDFAGCDTLLNLGYAYNAGNSDAEYQAIGMYPPAVGYSFLQGVSEYTGDQNDSAIVNFRWRHGYRFIQEKPMSSFIFFGPGVPWSDPSYTYTGTLEFYNLMRGYLPDPPYPDGEQFPSSVAEYSANGVYLLPGDPVAGTGKIDGGVAPAGDRRILLVSGPFQLTLGQTAEVVIALVAGSGNSNHASITKLKENTVEAKNSFLDLVSLGQVQVVKNEEEKNTLPGDFTLEQNYPNPFNPATTISYVIDRPSFVKLKVYDVLGNEVADPG